MKFLEAANKYEKIRQRCWEEEFHLVIKKGEILFFCKEYKNIDQFELNEDDWEEYKEPEKFLTHREAMQALIDGKKISEEFRQNKCFFILNEEGYIVDEAGRYDSPAFDLNYYNNTSSLKLYTQD